MTTPRALIEVMAMKNRIATLRSAITASGANGTTSHTTQNRPGTLLGLLTELAVRGIDLTRIESRPIKDRHAEYWFHLDCTGHIAEPAMGEAMAALHRRCDRVRFLGSYPRATNGASDGEDAAVSATVGDSDAAGFA